MHKEIEKENENMSFQETNNVIWKYLHNSQFVALKMRNQFEKCELKMSIKQKENKNLKEKNTLLIWTKQKRFKFMINLQIFGNKCNK